MREHQRPASGTRLSQQTAAIWPLLVVLATQVLVALLSIQVLAAGRAFVAGESIWTRSYKDAVYNLMIYVKNGDERAYQRYAAAIEVPIKARRARLAIGADPPDPEAGRSLLTAAGNSPEDAAAMVTMLRYGTGLSYLAKALRDWARVDVLILDLERLAGGIRDGQPWNAAGARAVADGAAAIDALNAEIALVASGFTRSVGEGARFVERTLAVANVALALILMGLTVWRVRRFLRQRQEVERALAWQAAHDTLTGIPNRRALEMRLVEVSATGSRHALMFLDLDQFKIVNDTGGHVAGDELLRRVCAPLQAALEPGDLLARLGGDEFGILLAEGPPERAVAVAEALCAAVRDLDFAWNGRAFQITASIGLLHAGDGAATPEAMMGAVDMACFLAKEKGRNRVHVHDRDDRDLTRHAGEMNWVQRIHQALKENRFCLHAQEIVPLSANREEGMHLELLIRLRDESGALVPPGSFLPAAERFGLMGLIDRWVVRAAFATLAARLEDAGAEPVACCAINLSGATLGDESFLGFLEDVFAEFRLPPGMICFEITETSAVTNLDAARVFVESLQARGCRFSLDDFGSGMSSFGYLKHLPVDFLKIDGGFVKNLLYDDVDRAMVVSINHIGHVMGKSIIAEFVESDALATALGLIGVDYGQGYGIARPRPFDASFRSAGAARDVVPDRQVA